MKVYNNDNLKNNMKMVKKMIEEQIYYCILKDGTLHIVSNTYYDINRKDLTAIAVGTIDEINEFLYDLGVMLDEGDEYK